MIYTLRRLFLLWSLCLCCCVSIYAQENFTGINDSVINLACNQTCTSLKFQVPHLKSSEDYAVVSVPYRPYAMTTSTGNALNVDEDDVYTDAINLPFPICFYGATTPYNQVVIGSNGLLTFDASNANCFNAWRIDKPIPSAGNGLPCPGATGDKQSSYYPRAAIMGPFMDLDPREKINGRKIEWRIEGVAPFRRFVASWNNIAVFGNLTCSSATPTSFQIVVNEGTSVVEIFIARQVCEPGGGSTKEAILGIQNWARDKAVTPPGRNATIWTAEKEGWRFVPSGATSRFVSSELLDINGNFLETATASASTPGIMDISFSSKCYTKPSEKFIIRTTYAGDCGSATPVIILDTITVNAGVVPLTYTTTNSGCATGTGSIKVNVTTGPGIAGPYTYILNPGAITINSTDPEATFSNLTAGHYSLTVNGAGGCSNTVPDIEVLSTGTFDVGYTVNPPSCLGASNASITLTPPAGGGPYTYAINGSPKPTNVITGLPGGWPYIVTVTASPTCSASISIPTIPQGTGTLTATAAPTATTCAGLNNGLITVTPTSGSGPYDYSINNGTNWQTGNIFSSLAPGDYNVLVREGACTSAPIPVTIAVGGGLTITGSSTSASCQGVNNGTVTIVMQNGTAPFSVQLNPATTLTTSTNTITFTNVAAGNYNVTVTDAGGCSNNAPGFAVSVATGGGITATSSVTDVSCFGGANGSIIVTPSGGSGPYSFSLNSGAAQSGAANYSFNGLTAANNYAVLVQDAIGCTTSLSGIAITQPDVLAIPAPTVQPPLCNGESNGTMTISSTGGISPYTYSLNGSAFQPANTFKVAAGSYTVRVLDSKSCNATLNNVLVTDPPVLTATIGSTANASCEGGANGTITVNAVGGTGAYQYSIDGTTFQGSNILKVISGTYTVTVKDANGCTATIPNVFVGLNNDLVFTPAADPAPICEGTSITLQTNSNATVYNWTPNQPGLINNPSTANPVVTPHTSTVFTVMLQLGICVAQDEIDVQVLPAPVPLAGPDGEICYGQNYQLQATGGVSYEWTPQRFLSDPYNPNPQVLQPDRTITYLVSTVDANNCKSLTPDEVTIKVVPPIRITVTPADTVVYAGAQFQFLASSVATDYVWTPSTSLSNAEIANPVATAPLTDGAVINYRISASTPAGCKGEGTATLRVYKGPDIYVANAFSPNNDGKNDVFLPFPVGIKQLSYFRVFNRWGQLLFSTKTLQHGWDGKLTGIEQPAGVYTWMIEAVTQDGRKIAKKGTVTLVR